MNILAIDQGTTSSRSVLYNDKGQIIDVAAQEFKQIFPQPGWVEHDPIEIWTTVINTIKKITKKNKGEIQAIGITNQRETTVVWDKNTGKPIYNAIVWQCRRTSDICNELKSKEKIFKKKTGLPLDAYFSGTKIKWILENVKGLKVDNLLFGTIDTWLIWKLTNGKTHATDHTNASRTLIYNIKQKKWDKELCNILNIPMSLLPEVKKSIDDYGTVESVKELKGIPIYGVAGDQQAALFGQTCFQKGEIKNTYGTGGFLMMNTGEKLVRSKNGLITTIAVNGKGEPCYALEGSVFICGAAIQWLRDELKFIKKASESESRAMSLSDNDGVYLVPAFVGLGAPYWDMEARGIITGLTRGTGIDHMIRAGLESMAFQSFDVVSAMEEDLKILIESIQVDGGAVANNFLMQFQADILNKEIIRPSIIESTSLGVCYMAGIKAGIWKDENQLKKMKLIDKKFNPKMERKTRIKNIEGWRTAVARTLVD
jgi:glycerol kinase